MLTPLSGKQGYINTLLVVSRGYGNILYSRDMEQRSWASLCARPVKPGSADIGILFPRSLLTASKMIQEVVATACTAFGKDIGSVFALDSGSIQNQAHRE